MSLATKQFTEDISNEETLLEKVNYDGVVCLEIFSSWCGPCKAIEAFMRNIATQNYGKKLLLLRASSNDIECLSLWKGHCMPIFIFIKNCEVKIVVNGLNTPLIVKMFKELLEDVGMTSEGISKDWSPIEPDEMRNRIVASGNRASINTSEGNTSDISQDLE